MEVNQAVEAKARGRFLASLILSLMIVLGAMAWTWKVGQANNKLFHEWSHVQETLEGFQASTKEASAR